MNVGGNLFAYELPLTLLVAPVTVMEEKVYYTPTQVTPTHHHLCHTQGGLSQIQRLHASEFLLCTNVTYACLLVLLTRLSH